MQEVLLDVLTEDLCEGALEREVDVRVVEGRRLDEQELVLLGERLRLLGRDRAQMLQIALVAHEHDHNLGHGVLAELAEPPAHVLVRLRLGDVVHEQRAHSTAVVRARDRPVPLLAGCVPNLRFYDLVIDVYRARGKLNSDGRLRLEVELVARESAKKITLAASGVAGENNLEQKIVLVAHSYSKSRPLVVLCCVVRKG